MGLSDIQVPMTSFWIFVSSFCEQGVQNLDGGVQMHPLSL